MATQSRRQTKKSMEEALRKFEADKLKAAAQREKEMLERRGLTDILLELPDKFKQLFKSRNR